MVDLETQEVSHAKWGKCVRLSDGTIELLATLDFGPRIMHLGAVGGENEFFEDYDDVISKGNEGGSFDIFGNKGCWHIYGGHRLWASPESYPRTYYPDNEPVKYKLIENGIRLTPQPQAWNNLQNEIEITIKEKSKVEVAHKTTNIGAWETELAPWAITVMKIGGLQVVPQPKKDTDLLGNRIIALWPYSEMDDSRVHWGKDYITLRPDASSRRAFKFGINSEHGWAAYFNHGNLFIKRFEPVDGGNYPDGGVSYETYTNGVMVELESLGELKKIKPNETVVHVEKWELILNVPKPQTKEEISAAVHKYINAGS